LNPFCSHMSSYFLFFLMDAILAALILSFASVNEIENEIEIYIVYIEVEVRSST